MQFISEQAGLDQLNKWYENVVGYKPSDERPELTAPELYAEILEYVAAVFEDEDVEAVPVVELKSVKHNAQMSEETHSFSATVYLDGVKVGEVGNRGHGGEDEWNAPRPKGGWKSGEAAGKADRAMWSILHLAMWRFELFGEDHAASWDPDLMMRDSLDGVVCDRVNDFLTSRDLRGAMRRKWLFSKSGKAGDSLYECKRAKGQDAATMADVIRKRDPGAVLLNELPIAEALEFWRAA